MTGSVMAVFSACAAASGRSFTPPQHGSVTKCPLHDDRAASLSLNESRGVFNCFAGCGKGGLLDAVVLFGLAGNHTDASRWLSERRLIPESDTSFSSKRDRTFVPLTLYTKSSDLEMEVGMFRWGALIDALDVIGHNALRLARDHIAAMRYERESKREARYAAITQSPPASNFSGPSTCPHSLAYGDACMDCERPKYPEGYANDAGLGV